MGRWSGIHHGFDHNHHRFVRRGFGFGFGFYDDYPYYSYYNDCWQWQHVRTRYGWRWRHVNVCYYPNY
jgi:hypothetical protein